MSEFQAIEATQNRLDQTVWAAELLAQRYEDVFIQLWDDLRSNENELGLLRNFPFETLTFGTPHLQTQHEYGIQELVLGRAPQEFSRDQSLILFSRLKSEGYRLEQTDWRQSQFEPGPPPKSVFYFSAHLRNTNRDERVAIRGNLRVDWGEAVGPLQKPMPQRINATDVHLLLRQDEPAFDLVLSAIIEPKRGNTFIDPLILYDLDGDGLSEIILGCRNLVLRNHGKGEFQRDMLCPRLQSLINTCLVADLDGDGLADFLAADNAGLLLFKGESGGRFEGAGLRVWSSKEPLPNPLVMTVGDIDRDGDLDIWLAQYKLPYVAGQMPTPYYDANDGFPSFLLVNDRHGNFRDGTEEAGLAKKRFRRTYSSSFVDLDDDGDLDLVVVSDFAGADVYYNDGHGHFTDVTHRLLDETHAFGMAHTFGDYDGDGKLDFFMIGMNSFVAQRLDALKLGPPGFPAHQTFRPKMGHGNRLYFSRGDRFIETPLSDQVARSGWSWGATSFDFDNDGDLDIYIVNGHKSRQSARDYETQFWRHDIYAATSELNPAMDLYFQATAQKLYGAGQSYGGYEENRLFMNESGTAFLEIAYLMDASSERDCRNVVSDDLDGDGKLDLVMTTFEEWPAKRQSLNILRNGWRPVGNWIGIRLRENAGANPVGAKIAVETSAGRQIRQLVTGDSYRSQHSNTTHFGLGKETSVKTVEVRWLNGQTTRIVNPAINQYHDLQPN